MAIRYYDDALVVKLKKWIPDNSTLRILKPEETTRLFETKADDQDDSPFKLPFIALSRNNDIELLLNIKAPMSYDGLKILKTPDGMSTAQFNVIPIKVEYQLDIYTKTYEEGDEYVRSFLFKLINNPVIKIVIPYNNTNIEHIANIRVLNNVSDTSNISERIFSGQFTRWTIQIELQDAFLFNIPYRTNWRFYTDDGAVVTPEELEVMLKGGLELSNKITEEGEFEQVPNLFTKYKNI